MDILAILNPYIDYKYKLFQEKICFTKYEILGIKIPYLRKIANDLVKNYSFKDIMASLNLPYYECIMLKGLIIAKLDTTYEEKIQLINSFLPHIDNWAVCDILAGELKIVKKYPQEFLNYIDKLIASNKEYAIRLGVVLLLNYYINEQYIDIILNKLLTINKQEYYVKMAISWAYSKCFSAYFVKTQKFFIQNKKVMDKWIYNKALQKARESLVISQEEKNILKEMKIN